jgi:hypothetical protein
MERTQESMNMMNKSRAHYSPTQARAQTAVSFVDGKDHINIWFKGDTELGRMLSHFYAMPFVHPYFGPFHSMEGFWYYIKTAEHDDKLRSLSGVEAKKAGKQFTQIMVDDFQDIIMAANFHKIDQNPHLKELFVASTLPFEYYYRHGPGGVVIRPSEGNNWLVDDFTYLRELMQEGKAPEEPSYEHVTKRS